MLLYMSLLIFYSSVEGKWKDCIIERVAVTAVPNTTISLFYYTVTYTHDGSQDVLECDNIRLQVPPAPPLVVTNSSDTIPTDITVKDNSIVATGEDNVQTNEADNSDDVSYFDIYIYDSCMTLHNERMCCTYIFIYSLLYIAYMV